MTPTLAQVCITARDVKSLTEFYRDQVGLKFLFAAGPNLSFLDGGGVRIMVSAPEGEAGPISNNTFYFKVEDLSAVFANAGLDWHDEPHLIAKMPDHELWMVFFRDPEGNLMGLMEERRA